MFVRRRPLLRAAAVGGTAYVAGKHKAERNAQISDAQQQSYEAKQMAYEAQQQQAQPAIQQPMGPSPVSAAPSQDRIDQLSKLAALHDSGVLSDAEFEQEKRRLLAS
jgi:hypothetical protein